METYLHLMVIFAKLGFSSVQINLYISQKSWSVEKHSKL